MKIARAFAIAAILSGSIPVLADEPAPKKEDVKKEDPNQRVVCHTDTDIGSRLRKSRTCMTVAQWRELNDQAGAATERKEVQTMLRGGG